MSYSYQPYEKAQARERFAPRTAMEATGNERLAFIQRVYGHLAGAVLVFVILEMLLFMAFAPNREAAMQIVPVLMGRGMWIAIFIGFIVSGMVARWWANSDFSPAMQYAGLGLCVVSWAAIFFPMLCIAVYYVNDYSLLPTAAILTLMIFGGLTAGVFITKKDFSFLGPILGVCSLVALGVIICGMLFGFSVGLWFSLAMVALVCGFILYDTSNVLHHYPTDKHVGAALELFASLALLFWYILMILMSRE